MEEYKNIINSIEPPLDDLRYEITYWISGPFKVDYNFKSKLLFVFATTEFKNIIKKDYINGDPNYLKNKADINGTHFLLNKAIQITKSCHA